MLGPVPGAVNPARTAAAGLVLAPALPLKWQGVSDIVFYSGWCRSALSAFPGYFSRSPHQRSGFVLFSRLVLRKAGRASEG